MAAGILASLGGATAPGAQPAAAGQDPDELLAQIRDLLEQYLALGPDKPVAHEAQALASAIDSHDLGGDSDEGSAAKEAAETPAEEAAEGDGVTRHGGNHANEPNTGSQPGPSPPLREGAPVNDRSSDPLHDHDPEAYSGSDMSKAREGAKAFLRKQNKKAKA